MTYKEAMLRTHLGFLLLIVVFLVLTLIAVLFAVISEGEKNAKASHSGSAAICYPVLSHRSL